MKLLKDTTFDRAALSQEWREILPADDGPENSYRHVRISIPYGTEIFISLLPDADQVYGVNRSYKGPIARPGAELVFNLRPTQVLYGCTRQGANSVAISVEFRAGDEP